MIYWFKSLIVITILLLVYNNANAHLKEVDKYSTKSFLNKKQSHKHPHVKFNEPLTKEEENKVIIDNLHKEGIIDDNKTIYRNPVTVPKRSTIIMERAQRKKTKFKNMLRREYLKLAERLTKHKNWTDATYFRRKAYKAGKTEQDILPEDPEKWNISDDFLMNELYETRVKLLDGLTANTIFLVPNAAAKSMAYYDCWVEQTQNEWIHKDIDCKQGFTDVYKYLKQAREELRMKTVINILENYPLVDVEEKFFPYKNSLEKDNEPYEGDYAKEMKEAVQQAYLAEQKKEQAANATNNSGKANAGFIVDQSGNDNPEIVFAAYFPEKSPVLTAKARGEIDKSIIEINKINPGLIIVNGHTDKAVSGSEALILSKKRADSVRDYLISKGIEKAKIRSYGFGNSDNLVENPEGEAVAGNRRAEIIFRAPAK